MDNKPFHLICLRSRLSFVFSITGSWGLG
jgi:hypothetical protein